MTHLLSVTHSRPMTHSSIVPPKYTWHIYDLRHNKYTQHTKDLWHTQDPWHTRQLFSWIHTAHLGSVTHSGPMAQSPKIQTLTTQSHDTVFRCRHFPVRRDIFRSTNPIWIKFYMGLTDSNRHVNRFLNFCWTNRIETKMEYIVPF